VGKPEAPTKKHFFALGMRRACVLARMVQRTEAIAQPAARRLRRAASRNAQKLSCLTSIIMLEVS